MKLNTKETIIIRDLIINERDFLMSLLHDIPKDSETEDSETDEWREQIKALDNIWIKLKL